MRTQQYKQLDYSRTQLDDTRDAGEMHNTVQKGATIRGCNATIQRWDNIGYKMRTMQDGEGKDLMYFSFLLRCYFTEVVIL